MREEKGYIALITILIVTSLAVFIASSANLLSIGEAKMGLAEGYSWQAYFLANACAEEALMTLKDGGTFSEEEDIIMGRGSCTIYPVEGNWILKVSGTVENITRRIRIEIETLEPQMEITSWQEVTSF